MNTELEALMVEMQKMRAELAEMLAKKTRAASVPDSFTVVQSNDRKGWVIRGRGRPAANLRIIEDCTNPLNLSRDPGTVYSVDENAKTLSAVLGVNPAREKTSPVSKPLEKKKLAPVPVDKQVTDQELDDFLADLEGVKRVKAA